MVPIKADKVIMVHTNVFIDIFEDAWRDGSGVGVGFIRAAALRPEVASVWIIQPVSVVINTTTLQLELAKMAGIMILAER